LLPSLAMAVPLIPREMPATDVPSEVFMGLGTFAHLPYERCLSNLAVPYDIAVVGIPFDTGTSYRPGARFGPSGIREGSRRTIVAGTYNVPLSIDPMTTGLTMVDCGDIPVTYVKTHPNSAMADFLF
jgi:agmatinase